MTNGERRRLRAVRRRIWLLLAEVDECGPESDLPQWPRIAAAKLREVARLCLSECYYLDQQKEEYNATL